MKIVDKKVKKLMRSAARKNHRSLILILGSSGLQQISTIHQLVSKINKTEISTLWCSIRDNLNLDLDYESDSSDKIDLQPLHCSYSNLEKIKHQAFNLVVLQDLNSLNLLSLNVILPSVKGGGAIVLLLPDVTWSEELKSFSMINDKHSSRFGKRFVQSLNLCSNYVALDGNINVLCSSKTVENMDEDISDLLPSEKLESIRSKYVDDKVLTTLLGLCQTADQAELLHKFLDILKKRTFHSIVSASSAYGRGKSAALGLAIAGSLALNYSNIFISSSSLNNVDVLFQFLLKGLDELEYEEDKHYDLIESANPKFNRALIGLNVFKDYPQSVRFIFPEDVGQKLEQAELVVVEEAASIPFDKLKQLFGPYIVLMSSSTSGALSTSPYLYNKMVENIQQSSQLLKDDASSMLSIGNSLLTLTLREPIHYASDDGLEHWSNNIFCVESTVPSQLSLGCPETQLCELYCVSRDFLFNGSAPAEKFLKSLISIFNQSNYVTNSEEIFKLADSSDYKIFVLLPPLPKNSNRLSLEVLCAVMVHTESSFPSDIVRRGSNLVHPVPDCLNEWRAKADNSNACGLHIINLATHPQYKRMGYGMRAFQLLNDLYEGKIISLEEKKLNHFDDNEEVSENQDSHLLQQLSEVKLERVDFTYVSFKVTPDIFSFWKKAGFVPVYMTTEKDSDNVKCYMIKSISEESNSYIKNNLISFRNHYFSLLKSKFQNFPALFALNILNSCHQSVNSNEISKEEVDMYLKPYHMKSLEKYCVRLQDINTVIHIIPIISQLYFKNLLKNIHIPVVQEAILLSFGLQNKSTEAISKDLALQNIQVIGLLNRTLKKIMNYLTEVIEKSVESTMISTDIEMKPLEQDLDEELEEAAVLVQKKEQEKLLDLDVSQYAIKGSEDEWQKALFSGRKTLVSIKSLKKKVENGNEDKMENKFKKPKKHGKKRKH